MLEGLGSRMDRVLLGKSLPESLALLDKGIPPSGSESIDSGINSPVRDIWSGEFRERTGDTAYGWNTEPTTRLGLLTLIAITHGNLGGLMKLARCPEQMKERVRNLDMKKSTDSWNKIRDLRHTLIQYLLQQNRFGTGEDETIEREEDVRRHVGGMPLLTDLSLAMRIDPLALIRGVTEFVTVIYDQQSPLRSLTLMWMHIGGRCAPEPHIGSDGSTLNWCEQHAFARAHE